MIQELNTDTDTQLFVGLSEDTESKEKFVVVFLRNEDKELFAQMTVDQTKELIKVLQQKVAYIENNI